MSPSIITIAIFFCFLCSCSQCGKEQTKKELESYSTQPLQKETERRKSSIGAEGGRSEPDAESHQQGKNFDPIRAEEHYQRAVELLKQNKIPAALDEMEQTFQFNPKHEGAYLFFLRGYKFQQENNYPKAVENYLSFLNKEEIQNTTTDEWQAEMTRNTIGNLAQAYFDWGMLSHSLFNSAINIELDYYNQEYALWKCKKLKSMNLNYNWYFRGICLAYAQQYEDAIAAFKQIQPNSDIYPQAQLALARCYAQTGKREVAQTLFQQIDAVGKKDPVIFSSLSVFLTEFFPSRKQEGLANCEVTYSLARGAGVKANVRNTVIRNLSQAYYNTAQIDKALEYLRKLDPKLPEFEDASGAKFFDPSLFRLQAQIYLSKGIEYYQKVVEKIGEEKTSSQLYRIGESFLVLGKYDDAISIFQKLIEKTVGKRLRASTIISLGICYYNKGNSEKAAELWNSVQTERDVLIQSEMGYTFARLGINLDLALVLCKRTEAEVAEQGVLAANLGTAYFHKGIQEKNKKKQGELFWQAIGQLGSYIGNSVDFRRGDWRAPLLLINLANGYYLVHRFQKSTTIFLYFRDDYPEVEQLFIACQLTQENWRRIQWHSEYRPTETLWYGDWFGGLQ
jgi:tetratricopeptide (TPR) repeat protein